MSKYDDEYFFIRSDDDNERLPALTPDTNTNERRYAQQRPAPGSAPLIFTNGWKEEFAARRVKDEVADILFEGVNFIVRDHIRERLLALEIPHLYMHPAVYIDDLGNWHEDFWFVGITKEFDCWDRATSAYAKKQMTIGSETLYSMYTYSLNSDLLDQTPLPERLLFQMGGTLDGRITCHVSLAALFRGNGKNGARLQAIRDY
jgi:hypothetical protein